MKLALIVAIAGGGSLLATFAMAKPDKVDGMNVPMGRILQEIKDNRYPRTYFPGTEKVSKDEMRITALGTGMPNQSPSSEWPKEGELLGVNPPPTQPID